MWFLALTLACANQTGFYAPGQDGGVLPGVGDEFAGPGWTDDNSQPWQGGETALPCDGDQQVGALDDLDSFQADACGAVTGDLVISGVAGLEYLSLPDLKAVDGDLTIIANPDLRSIDLAGLTLISGDISLVGPQVGDTNPLLESVALPALIAVGGRLDTGAMATVHSLDLGALWFTGGSVFIDLSEDAVEVDLGNLERVDGDLTLWGDGLQAVDLDLLEEARDLDLDYGGARIALPNLHTVRDISASDGELSVPSLHEVRNLGDFDGIRLHKLDLPNLERADGDVNLVIEASRADLPALRYVGGDLHLTAAHDEGDPTGPQVTAMVLHDLVYVGGDLQVDGQMVGEGELGLGALLAVGGDTSIEGVQSLDLDRLHVTYGDLAIERTGIEWLSLPLLSSVDGDLVVADNDALTELGAPALGYVGGDLRIVDNPLLPTCIGEDLVDMVLGRDGVGGDVDVSGNADDACAQDVDES